MKPRVLLLSQDVHCIPPLTGAAVEQWIDAVAHRLDGCESHIVSPGHPLRPDDEVAGRVRYHRIRVGRLYKRLFQKLSRLDPWSYTDRVIRYAAQVRPDIIHLHNAPRFADALKKGVPQARLILHMHNEKDVALAGPVDALVGCSEYVSRWYQARHVPAHRFAVLPNGVDTAAFQPAPEQRAAVCARFGVPAGRFIVLYAGRISPEKGPDLLAEAFRHLPAERFHLVLVGEWPQGDGRSNERVAFADKLRELLSGVPATVLGNFPPAEMAAIYRMGDLLAIPSRFEEPFSMVAIEAMASGLPVLALRRGGMVEYMVDGENALLLDPSVAAADLAAAIEGCARDGAAAKRRAGKARQLVEARFDWRQVAAATQALYEQVLA